MTPRPHRFAGHGLALGAFLFFVIISIGYTGMAEACRCTRTAELWYHAHPDHIIKTGALMDRLGSAVATSCFGIGKIRPEYQLALTIEVFDEPEGRYIPGFADELTDSIYGPEKARAVVPDKYGPFFSKATLVLNYIGGDSGGGTELVDRWRSFATTKDIDEHEALLLAEVTAGPPLHEVVWDWEAAPDTFELSVDKPCADPNEKVTIERKKIRDWRGSACNPGLLAISDHARFLIQILDQGKGRADFGDETKDRSRAMIHDNCDRKFVYQTSKREDWDEVPIKGFSSCDVLRRRIKPMADTTKKEEVSKTVVRNKKRLPADCSIRATQGVIRAGQIGTIQIKGIVDTLGDRVAAYDRLFIKAKRGKIVNGKKLGGMRAFDVGDLGKITVKYKAPGNCKLKTDEIIVHTSCSTSEKAAEEPGPEIVRETIAISCGYAATVTGRHTLTSRTKYDHTWPNGNRDQRVDKHDTKILATIRMSFTPSGADINKDTETVTKTFAVNQCSLGAFSATGVAYRDEHHTDKDRDCSWELTRRKTAKFTRPEARCEGNLSIAFDLNTGKAKYIALPVLGITYDGSAVVKQSSSGCGNSNSQDDTITTGQTTFSIGPTDSPSGEDLKHKAGPELAQLNQMARELQALSQTAPGMSEEQLEAFVKQFEKKYDPAALTKSMEPKLVSEDLKVTGGDGKTNLTGGGIKRDREQIEGGYTETVNELKWRIFLKQ